MTVDLARARLSGDGRVVRDGEGPLAPRRLQPGRRHVAVAGDEAAAFPAHGAGQWRRT